ncbi:acetyl-CoA hydrolase/transferase family protein [Parvularcula lutaonensis]|uniref:acetyl-CoA hydrolase/transferase family protein n=1 Tax=Parvularcula lutaonensis TaxID=491923 RepID=UPI00167724E2|nr:acetyl-CoA hydrolase/transferase C-terminal domain-containing protein [Parvularcula lutaonensis]
MAEAFRHEPALAEGLTFFGIWIPGVNVTDWASLAPGARAESIFVTPATRESFANRKTAFRPLSYTQACQWLARTPCDGAFVMTSEELSGDPGTVSLGVACDFSQIILEREDVPVMGIINRQMPAPGRSPSVSKARFSHEVQSDYPLINVPPTDLPEKFEAIGKHVAMLIESRDTLQLGLGSVQQAVLEALTDHRDLKIHSGMVSDPILNLMDTGAISSEDGSITTGVAIGSSQLYEAAGREPQFRFEPVTNTHALATLSAIPRFKAVNSAIEVDLFGQVNAEFLSGRQVSGTGGLVDFLRGAATSPGGRGIIALASSARNGTISRIVPHLARSAVSVARGDVETVVTEHGVADLRHATDIERAERLIAIAAPEHRPSLEQAWAEIERIL